MATEAELLSTAKHEALQTTVPWAQWVRDVQTKENYDPTQAHWYHAGQALEGLKHLSAPPVTPPPTTPPSYGTIASATPFAGRGIMLGSNPDVWDQALGIARERCLEVVAHIPGLPLQFIKDFTDLGVATVQWLPPHLTGNAHILQSENVGEWVKIATFTKLGICTNSWTYGKFTNKVALVEVYYNEGWGVDFNIFKNYMAQEARAVIPVCGGYSAPGRSDQESARLYQSLSTSVDTPGFWMYAGESLITPQSVEVLKAWRP
jgi:hypothetical protein